MVKERPGFSFKYITQKRYLTTENAKSITVKFGFTDAPEKLVDKLNYAAGWFDAWKNPSQSSPEDKKDRNFFEEMAGLAEALTERFDALGFASKDFLDAAETYGLDIDLNAFKWKLTQVSYVAKYVAKQIPDKTAGRPDDIALQDFITRLRDIYLTGTGKSDRITYNPYTELYSGNFFEFVKACLSIVGVTGMSNGALGKAIYKTLARIE